MKPLPFHIIIPARRDSQRLPGKALLEVAGQPIIAHTVRQALACRPETVSVATDDSDIASAAQAAGASPLMTRSDHPSGTDRLGEAVDLLELDDEAIVVNLQGDEPQMPIEPVHAVAERLAEGGCAVATLAVPFGDESMNDPNRVKVVLDAQGRALYFSRSAIPHRRFDVAQDAEIPCQTLRHVGLYAYRAGFLRRWVQTTPCALEQCERLEQLRILFYGESIAVAIHTGDIPEGVDTSEQLQALRRELNGSDQN